MLIDEKNLKNLNGERPDYDERFDKRAFQSKYTEDLIKGIVEIVKNGVDAYINEKGEDKCDYEEIKIALENLNTKNPIVRITNFASGMDYLQFRKALKIGADTSGEKEGTTGAHGYGMKEASWAFKFTKIISVKSNKYCSRIFYWEDEKPKYAWDKDSKGNEIKDVPVTESIRTETGIVDEGTFFEAVVPDEISFPRVDNLRNKLSNSIFLRTINQSEKFKITISYKDSKTGQPITLPVKYAQPDILQLREDRKAEEIGQFSFNYPGYGNLFCSYEIFLSTIELEAIGDTREAGILICAGSFSVLDCTLFELGDRVGKRFFGKAILSGPIRKISKNEKIVDDKRESGLIKKTPLYENLYKHFNPILDKLIDKERKRQNKKTAEVDQGILENKLELIKAFNRIDKEETDEAGEIKGDVKFIPGPNGIRFCVLEYLKLIEKQERKVHIVIDPALIPIGSEVELKADKEGLLINPTSFIVDKAGIEKDEVFKKKISFESCIIDLFKVTATVKNYLNEADMNVDVVKDQRLHIKNALEFIPKEDDLVVSKSKELPLIIDFLRIKKQDKLVLEYDKQLFMIHKSVDLKDAKCISEPYYELLIPVHCIGKIKQKGTIKAVVEKDSSEIKLTIIDSKDRHLRGDFEGIKDDPAEDVDEISYYEKKIVYVCINHPLLKHYRRSKEQENNAMYRALYSDVIIREFLKYIAIKKLRPFNNLLADDYRAKLYNKFDELYKKHSTKLHRFCINPENLEKLKTE